MALKSIQQRGWLRGLNASIGYAVAPKGTLARISNFLYTQRGALVSCDQNLGISSLNGAGPATAQGAFLELILFLPPPMGTSFGTTALLMSLLQVPGATDLVVHVGF